ncbi:MULTISPECIES: exopolysaccharide production repressor protein [unclassified Mesorhizobium]|uniref:exopolysaccharide production repressor protein n=1 Tax=unclassified Mesorhizobium TaxID=325217 RepID=UPI001FE06134|nr:MULTISPECIES: exopolysaccharide production repressor protein [unclassified Mesorhizobium]
MLFCRLLGLVLCGNAMIVYLASHSIPLAVIATLACSLLLQVVYFGSVLVLIRRSRCACRADKKAKPFMTHLETSRRKMTS